MKRIVEHSNPPVYKNVTWSDHRAGCAKCAEVDVERAATFALTCAEGGPLLMEELTKRQAPTVRANAKAVREWAKKAGVFNDA